MIDKLSTKQLKSQSVPTKSSKPLTSSSSRFLDEDVDSLVKADLNKVSEDTLKKAKSKMNTAFEQNKLKPGDTGYEYDKRVCMTVILPCSVRLFVRLTNSLEQVAFKPKETSDWDEGDMDEGLDDDDDDLFI